MEFVPQVAKVAAREEISKESCNVRSSLLEGRKVSYIDINLPVNGRPGRRTHSCGAAASRAASYSQPLACDARTWQDIVRERRRKESMRM